MMQVGPRYLWLCTVTRLLFLPFFLLCNYQSNERTLPVVFTSDLAYITGVVLLGLSNGYFSSLAMMYAPRCVHGESRLFSLEATTTIAAQDSDWRQGARRRYDRRLLSNSRFACAVSYGSLNHSRECRHLRRRQLRVGAVDHRQERGRVAAGHGIPAA